ncbi:MAG TPA: flagellin [Vicinamibacterales bacterium]|jgi:flagellin
MASFSVVSNIASANAQANLSINNVGLQRSLNRLSSGFRINYSGDDAAGLAVANGYRSDVAVLNQGIRNANDGLSTLQIKDGALNNISTLLDRLATLASQSASSAFNGSRDTLNAEFVAIVGEIDRESSVAGLNTVQQFSVFVGSGSTVGGTIGMVTSGATSLALSGVGIATDATAKSAIALISSAVSILGSVQGSIGTLENRLQFAVALGQSQVVNTKGAESRIRDANVAEESANMTRYNILNQSGIAVLAQANQSSSAVLSLLRG